jgi:hypothetical protein
MVPRSASSAAEIVRRRNRRGLWWLAPLCVVVFALLVWPHDDAFGLPRGPLLLIVVLLAVAAAIAVLSLESLESGVVKPRFFGPYEKSKNPRAYFVVMAVRLLICVCAVSAAFAVAITIR